MTDTKKYGLFDNIGFPQPRFHSRVRGRRGLGGQSHLANQPRGSEDRLHCGPNRKPTMTDALFSTACKSSQGFVPVSCMGWAGERRVWL